ncbi:MAG TPA: hypothetical protein VKS60_02505 [Stellaceae bacterium]|nr:hypothetical protein [Stellaceae bacterium]
MIPLSFLWIALDIFCVIHAMRNGADRMWIYVIVLLPGVGSIAYLIAEALPQMYGTKARKLAGSAIRTIDPERNLRRLEADLALVDSAENKRRVAEEQMKLGRYREAMELIESALVGIHADDPSLLLALARAAEGSADYARALDALDHLRAAHPDFQSGEAHLIYARSLQGLGRDEEAMRELASLVTYATGEEARCRYAMLLRRHGREAEAQIVFKEILLRAKRANRRYRSTEREWIDTARREAVT